MSGLQRRRGAGASNGSSSGAGSEPNQQQHVSGQTGLGHRHSNSNEDGDDHLIAYDPEDEPRVGRDGLTQPVLTLMEEVLLAGLKDSEGYLSFWNDSISYVLRGCIMIELALGGRIAMVNDPVRRRLPLPDRLVEVIDDKSTGEVLLDETLRLMRQSEPMSVNQWMDSLSGETWSISKIGYQLKQVRERLAKGLVDKGICRTEKKNFFLFDMATHPVADASAKEEIRRRLAGVLAAPSYNPPQGTKWMPSRVPHRTLRTIALAASVYSANVLENLFSRMNYDQRDSASLRADEILADYSEFPFLHRDAGWAVSLRQAYEADEAGFDAARLAPQLEIVAAVIRVYTQLDAVL